MLYHHPYDVATAVQLFVPRTSNILYFRRRVAGAWQSWVRVLSDAQLLGTVAQSGGVPLGSICLGPEHGTGRVRVLRYRCRSLLELAARHRCSEPHRIDALSPSIRRRDRSATIRSADLEHPVFPPEGRRRVAVVGSRAVRRSVAGYSGSVWRSPAWVDIRQSPSAVQDGSVRGCLGSTSTARWSCDAMRRLASRVVLPPTEYSPSRARFGRTPVHGGWR